MINFCNILNSPFKINEKKYIITLNFMFINIENYIQTVPPHNLITTHLES